MLQTSAESQSWSLQLNIDDEIKMNMRVLMQCYDEIKSIIRLVKDKNNKATIENNSITIDYQNTLKVWNDTSNANKILQEKISELKNLSETNTKLKQEIVSLELVYKKNISQISRLKEEKMNSSQISFNKPPLNLDLDDEFLGFDSVTISQSETHIGSHKYTSYKSFYYKIKNDSKEVKNAIISLLTMMDQTNTSLDAEIRNINSVKYQIIQNSMTICEQFDSIFQGDQDAIDDLIKKRCVWEEIKSNHARHLNALESDLISLGNRVKSAVRIPTNMACHNYANWYLKKLSIQQLYNIWSKMIEWTCISTRRL